MKKTTATSPRFTLNFANQTIVGTKASFDKASKGTGPIYGELVALIEKHPTFGFTIKEQEKHSTKITTVILIADGEPLSGIYLLRRKKELIPSS